MIIKLFFQNTLYAIKFDFVFHRILLLNVYNVICDVIILIIKIDYSINLSSMRKHILI